MRLIKKNTETLNPKSYSSNKFPPQISWKSQHSFVRYSLDSKSSSISIVIIIIVVVVFITSFGQTNRELSRSLNQHSVESKNRVIRVGVCVGERVS